MAGYPCFPKKVLDCEIYLPCLHYDIMQFIDYNKHRLALWCILGYTQFSHTFSLKNTTNYLSPVADDNHNKIYILKN